MVSFPDIPEALTSGKSEKQALEMAKDALMTALDFYFDERYHSPGNQPDDAPDSRDQD